MYLRQGEFVGGFAMTTLGEVKYRVRKAAADLGRFGITGLVSATGLNETSVRTEVARMMKDGLVRTGPGPRKKANAVKRGRPRVTYAVITGRREELFDSIKGFQEGALTPYQRVAEVFLDGAATLDNAAVQAAVPRDHASSILWHLLSKGYVEPHLGSGSGQGDSRGHYRATDDRDLRLEFIASMRGVTDITPPAEPRSDHYYLARSLLSRAARTQPDDMDAIRELARVASLNTDPSVPREIEATRRLIVDGALEELKQAKKESAKGHADFNSAYLDLQTGIAHLLEACWVPWPYYLVTEESWDSIFLAEKSLRSAEATFRELGISKELDRVLLHLRSLSLLQLMVQLRRKPNSASIFLVLEAVGELLHQSGIPTYVATALAPVAALAQPTRSPIGHKVGAAEEASEAIPFLVDRGSYEEELKA